MEFLLSRITFFKGSFSPITAGTEYSTDPSDSPSIPVQLCNCPTPLPKSSPVSLTSDQVSELFCREADLKFLPTPSSRSIIDWPLRMLGLLDRKSSEPLVMADDHCDEKNMYFLGHNTGVGQGDESSIDPEKESICSSFSILGLETANTQAEEEFIDQENDSYSDVGSTRGRNEQISQKNFDKENDGSSFTNIPCGNEKLINISCEDAKSPSPSPLPSLGCDKADNDDSTHVSSLLVSEVGKPVDDSKLLASKKSWLAGLLTLWTASKRKASDKQPQEYPEVNFGEDPIQIPLDPSRKTCPESSLLESKDTRLESYGCDGGSACCGSGCCSQLEVPFTRVVHTQESFSKFLQDASLFDMKVFAPLSFLCDMAYTIPKIQPGNLMKSHRLKFVTSSIDKKAASEANAKKAELSSTSSGKETMNDRNVKSSEIANFQEAKAKETKMAMVKDLQSCHSCPCEWFVCDDAGSCTRYFVIQGSETLASWQTNLSFKPTKFEGLDVLVHHGIYEAGKGLYEQVLPEVLAHLNKHGDCAQIRFTGHSLGGSLAVLLALMFQIRGVVTSKAILPVVTFGSPCVMCGGDLLLRMLELPRNHIQSIIMHQDIVPRAFSCDYPDHVAHVLKRLNGRFRDHPCLNSQKLLYAPMGQIFVLQPQEKVAPPHALLPRGHGLYLLRHPINGEDTKYEIELRAAQRAFLNTPHPLETLSDPGAYGLNGTISRDHNPSSYTEAIHTALKYEIKRLRRVQRQRRSKMLQPALISESSVWVKKGTPKLGLTVELAIKHGPLTRPVGKTLTFMQSMNFSTSNPNTFALYNMPIWASYKNAFGRYARTIASKHVKVGMLFVVSLHVVVLRCLSTLQWV